ncbi:hypothetical protein [Parashewanella tropica]|uniref:hypothetical protein n=1 Tax=Parashewanella tropica TaxID=2547970 RepID=UPI0010598380|nr:hypothetical protein [Parashewanella tropica]
MAAKVTPDESLKADYQAVKQEDQIQGAQTVGRFMMTAQFVDANTESKTVDVNSKVTEFFSEKSSDCRDQKTQTEQQTRGVCSEIEHKNVGDELNVTPIVDEQIIDFTAVSNLIRTYQHSSVLVVLEMEHVLVNVDLSDPNPEYTTYTPISTQLFDQIDQWSQLHSALTCVVFSSLPRQKLVRAMSQSSKFERFPTKAITYWISTANREGYSKINRLETLIDKKMQGVGKIIVVDVDTSSFVEAKKTFKDKVKTFQFMAGIPNRLQWCKKLEGIDDESSEEFKLMCPEMHQAWRDYLAFKQTQ